MERQIPATVCIGPPPPRNGKYITILSIDGGGVRGIIPGVILEYLESKFQEIDGKEARLADYFDVIAGTSTGGLVTAMLTAPDINNRPLYAANAIVPFYKDKCPKIFPQTWWGIIPIPRKARMAKAMWGPMYDGDELKGIIRGELGETKIKQTLTNAVIPSFDIKTMEPVIFSKLQAASESDKKNAPLKDICIGTSAAPIYLPAYEFNNEGRDFNLIDGGVSANNPTMVAITEVERQIKKEHSYFKGISALDFKEILVISIGTGVQKQEPRYDAKTAAEWGVLSWIVNWDLSSPLLTAFMEASSEMVDYHCEKAFDGSDASSNYLRIQDDTLSGDMVSMDLATEKNLNDLVDVGKNLLNKQVSKVNLDTGIVEPVKGAGLNREALKSFAEKLSAEQKLRMLNYCGGSA